MQAMARLMEASPKEGKIILNSLSRDQCRTEMTRETKGLFQCFVMGVTSLMTGTVEAGARTLIDGAATSFQISFLNQQTRSENSYEQEELLKYELQNLGKQYNPNSNKL